MTTQFPAGFIRVRPGTEVVIVFQRCDRAFQRQDLQTVFGQLEVADDLRPQQTHDVGEDGEFEAGINFFRDRGTAHEWTFLEHEHLAPGSGQVSGSHQSVVTSAHNDRIVTSVLLCHLPRDSIRVPTAAAYAFLLSRSRKGSLCTTAAMRWRRCSTVISSSTAVPAAK